MPRLRFFPILFFVSLLLLSFGTVGCSDDPVSAEVEAEATNPFIGRWQVEGFDITAAFNSKQRVFVDAAQGDDCLGSYRFNAAQQTFPIDYEDGQPTCLDMTTSYTFVSDDEVRFAGAVTYLRLDHQDDRSF